MPSNKDKVSSYLETNEIQALDSFCEEKECSRSQGVAYLIQEKLMHDEEVSLSVTYSSEIEDKLDLLEKAYIAQEKTQTHLCNKNEKLEELIAQLQGDLCRLRKQAQIEDNQWLRDANIAAVTGKPEALVKLWRCGHQKPRGKNILKALEPYEIVDGTWRKKRA